MMSIGYARHALHHSTGGSRSASQEIRPLSSTKTGDFATSDASERRPPGSRSDRNIPSSEGVVVRFSYRMVPEVYQVFWAGMAAGEFINDAAIAPAVITCE